MPSQVDLCNKALRRLGEDPIIALDGNSIWSGRCAAALPEVVNSVLSLDIWRSCTKRTQLAAEAEDPIGFQSAYPMPSDSLRLAGIKIGQYSDWALEGNKILTQVGKTTALEILYVSKVTDPNKYTTPLYDAIAMGLAHELSGYSTATNVSKDEIYSLYVEMVTTAQLINSREMPVTFLASTSWVDVRSANQDRSIDGQYEVH